LHNLLVTMATRKTARDTVVTGEYFVRSVAMRMHLSEVFSLFLPFLLKLFARLGLLSVHHANVLVYEEGVASREQAAGVTGIRNSTRFNSR
jgi:hypothetical protein